MTYNLTFISNTTSLAQIFTGINDNSGGWFVGLLLIFFFILFFMVFKNVDTKTVFVGGTFVTTLIAGLFFFAGMVEIWVVGVLIAALVVSLIVKLWSDG